MKNDQVMGFQGVGFADPPPVRRRGRPELGGDLQALHEQAQAMRQGFGRARSAYNGRVCDLIAAAGLSPSANLVLQVGRWGTMADIQADVRAWWREIAHERAQREPAIPSQARRQALDLVEQMFALAQRTSEDRLQAQLGPLEEALEQQKALAQGLEFQREALVQEVAAQKELADRSAAEARAEQDRLRMEVDRVQDALEVARTMGAELERLLAACREEALAKERALERELAASRQEAARDAAEASLTLLREQQRAQADQRALLVRMDEERTQSGKLLEKISAELSQARQKMDQQAAALSEQAAALASARHEVATLGERLQALQAPGHRADLAVEIIELLAEAGVRWPDRSQAAESAEMGQDRQRRLQEAVSRWVGDPDAAKAVMRRAIVFSAEQLQ